MPSEYEKAIKDYRAKLLQRDQVTLNDLSQHYAGVYTLLGKQMQDVLAKVKELNEAGAPPTPGLIYRQTRLKSLMDQVHDQLVHFSQYADQRITQAQIQAIFDAHADTRELIKAGLSSETEIPNSFLKFDPRAAEEMAGRLSEGSPLRDLLRQLPNATVQNVEQALFDGVAAGKGTAAVAREVRDASDVSLTRAQTIARTEVVGTYRTASLEGYKSNEDVVKRWRWSADLGARSCGFCIAMDGREFDLDVPFDSHPNCRCSPVPVTATLEELGFPPGIESPPSHTDKETGAQWFDWQSEDVQRQILGKTKFELYHEGKLELQDLIGYRKDPKWGGTGWERSLKQIRSNEYEPPKFFLGLPPATPGAVHGLADLTTPTPIAGGKIELMIPKGLHDWFKENVPEDYPELKAAVEAGIHKKWVHTVLDEEAGRQFVSFSQEMEAAGRLKGAAKAAAGRLRDELEQHYEFSKKPAPEPKPKPEPKRIEPPAPEPKSPGGSEHPPIEVRIPTGLHAQLLSIVKQGDPELKSELGKALSSSRLKGYQFTTLNRQAADELVAHLETNPERFSGPARNAAERLKGELKEHFAGVPKPEPPKPAAPKVAAPKVAAPKEDKGELELTVSKGFFERLSFRGAGVHPELDRALREAKVGGQVTLRLNEQAAGALKGYLEEEKGEYPSRVLERVQAEIQGHFTEGLRVPSVEGHFDSVRQFWSWDPKAFDTAEGTKWQDKARATVEKAARQLDKVVKVPKATRRLDLTLEDGKSEAAHGIKDWWGLFSPQGGATSGKPALKMAYSVFEAEKKGLTEASGIVAHEFGHFIDWASSGKRIGRTLATERAAAGDKDLPHYEEWRAFLDAARNTPEYRLLKAGVGRRTEYMSDERELFARSFAQYALKKDTGGIAGARGGYLITKDLESWKRIEKAIDSLIQAIGWAP